MATIDPSTRPPRSTIACRIGVPSAPAKSGCVPRPNELLASWRSHAVSKPTEAERHAIPGPSRAASEIAGDQANLPGLLPCLPEVVPPSLATQNLPINDGIAP